MILHLDGNLLHILFLTSGLNYESIIRAQLRRPLAPALPLGHATRASFQGFSLGSLPRQGSAKPNSHAPLMQIPGSLGLLEDAIGTITKRI